MIKEPSQSKNEEITQEEEGNWINPAKYFEPLVRQWQWILICTLGFGILVFALAYINNHLSPSYRAVALVASAKTAAIADFGSAISSTTDSQMQLTSGNALFDPQIRLQSFVTQVYNGDIAEQVLQEIGPSLPSTKDKQITASDLLGMVSADLIRNTDTIQISVTNEDPILAAKIANSWSKAYVDRINVLYGGASSGTAYLVTESDVAQAKTAYESAEEELAGFIVNDKTAEYNRQIEELSAIITLLRGARTTVGNQQLQDHQTRLDEAYSDSRQSSLFLDNAISLRLAVKAGGEPAAISNALALTMLKTQIYAAYPGTNSLQVQNLPEALGGNIATVNATGMVNDLDALISTLQTRLTDLNKQIATLSSDVQNEDYLMNFTNSKTPIEIKIEENEQRIRDLNSLVSAQTSKLGELTLTRDLAWKSFSALATKATEISSTIQNIQVVFAAPATPPIASANTSAQKAAEIAALLGLFLAIFIAYAYEFWQNYKEHQPEVIVNKMFLFTKSLFKKQSKLGQQ
jgi:capsular polysaccharide biosynthesis protein